MRINLLPDNLKFWSKEYMLKMASVFFGILFFSNAFATIETYSVRKEVASFSPVTNPAGFTFYIQDGRFSELNSSPSFVDESVNLRVKFGVQERSTFGYIPAYASLSATVTIYPVDNNGIVLTALPVQTLTISYQPDGNPATPYDFNTSIFKHSGYHKYKIHVAPITNAPENIYLEAELNVNRYYEMVQTTPTVLSANYIFYDPISGIESKNPIVNNAGEGVPAVGEIEIAWDYLEGAEEYELEWTWVDNYSTSPGVQIAASAYVFNERMFENNNTRIITQDQNYRIPIVFSQGFLIYRVRGVGRWIDNGFADVNLKKFGAWSTAGSPVTSITAKVSNWPHYIIVDTEHEALKNWQYQAVYAEEGKKKEIISYFDGSLRNRQTVTRINSDNNAVVGESIYDNQGRSAIQILPAPVANPALRYYQKLNVNYALEPYSHRDFDWEPATGGLACVAAASGLSDNIGASKYYSTNNSATGNWQDYVADGEDFPFVQVEYTPDNTGRIRKQSGVGPDYKIDGQHATQYYYLQPFQEELDRLFGYQVGYKSRYKKNLVVDANGQVSISYIDPQGRVIATALAGTNTDAGSPTGTKTNLVSLEDEVSGIHLTVSVDLLNKLGIDLPDSPSDDNLLSASGTNGSENDQLILNTQHASVDNDNPHGFTYRVRSSVFTDCNLSYPFAYDLIIEVRDECGNSMITSTEADKNGVVSTLPDGQIHETVNVAGADYTFTFSSLLDVKSYTISKRLKVDEALLDSYAQDFIANNTCLIPYEEFLQNNVDCDDPLPENEPFMELNTCNISRGMMLGDLSPGGQYGETSGTDPMSVFTLTNVLDKGNISTVKNWQHPVGQYVDAYGNPSYVEVTPDPLNPGQYDLQFTGSAFTVSGQPGWYIYPQQLVNVQDFINSWNISWAEALITYHPEYEYLVPFDELCQFTGTTLPISSEKYDAELMEIQTYAEATNPTNSFGVNLLANIDNIMLYDPYFEAPYTYTENVLAGGNTFKEILMTEILHNYKQDFPADGAHLWETAVNAAVCSPDYAGTCAITTAMANGDLTGLSVAEQDQAWSNFRALYISEKKKINQVFIDSYAISNGFYNGYIGESAPSYPAITGFLYYTDHVLPGLSIAFPPPTFYGGSVHLLSFYATALVNSGAGLTWMSAPFTPLYQDKIRRFIPIDNLYDSSMPETIIISSTEEVVDAEIYNQTGKCDLAIDVEYFLNGMATASLFDEALSTGVPSYQIPELSPDLYTAMGGVIMSPGVTGTTVNVTATQTSNSITITANSADGIAAMQSITLNKPIGATWNWTDVVGFSTIWYQFGTNYNFEILATVMISGSPVEVVLTGSTGIQIGNCVYQQPCERDETFGHEVFFIFNNLFNQSLLNTSVSSNVTATTVTQGWYESSEMQTQLVDFASTATFTNNPAGYFSIATSSHELKVNFGSYPSNILVVNSAAYNPTSQQITLYYVNTSGVEMTATATVTYTINNVPANMDLNCDGCQLETDIETAFENLLNYIIQQDLAGTLTGSSMPNFSQLNALAPYLTVSSPEIHFMFGAGTISDDNEFRFRFSKTECPITFQQISTSEDLTNLVGIYNLQITPGFLGVDITCIGAIDNGSGIVMVPLIASRFACLDFDGCQDCIPMALRPQSCNDKWNTYNTTIGALNANITTLYDDFPMYTVEDFCAGNFAYATDAYLHYINQMNVTDDNSDFYLTIAQFSNTQIGSGFYDQNTNTDLSDIVDLYVAYEAMPANNGTTWSNYINNVYMPQATICPNQLPLELDLTVEFPCEQLTANIDTVNAQNQYNIYIDNIIASFKERYIEEAMSTVIENFDMTYNDKEYHYTLYYYDQAGNLIQTIPPQGIDRIEQSEIDQTTIDNTRLTASMSGPTGPGVLPEHTFATNYHYNSLNQLVYQTTPDGGESFFAYDKLGRLVVSQNAKQKNHVGGEQFSYTRYDGIGRIIEVGEMTLSGNYDFNQNGKFINPSGFLVDVESSLFPDNIGAVKEEVTLTVYDEVLSPAVELLFEDYAKFNTRNRITGVLYFDNYVTGDLNYTNATFYDYDVHGNVKEVIQDNQDVDLVAMGQNIKKTKYEYDLVSGNVKEVAYQNEEADQFVHQYKYDSDNRITNVFTSKDRETWEQDAKYFYYQHGPLARSEMGDVKVQACDYAYTIQGWIKGVNSENLDRSKDQGKDGKMNTINRMNAGDSYGYSLHYFDGDYQSRQNNNDFLAYSETTSAYSSNLNLFNGNIKEMYTASTDLNEEYIGTNHTWYSYDQLNRIKSMNDEIIEGTTITANQYASSYTYDRNGNLQNLTRYIASVGGAVDNLTYHYVSPTNNQLAWVEDPIDAAGIDDLEGQAAGNYTYTAIGELYSDASEDIESIDWKVTGKIKRINRENSSTQPEVEFVYDAMGNRIAKIEYTSTGDLIDKTFYSLDAQGNVMAIYTLEIDNPNKNLYLSERNIYGSSRVGVERVDQIIVSTVASNVNINSENTASVVVQKTGDKRYELSNHLGNVLEVVTDRKLRKSEGFQFDLSSITTGSICVSANVWTPEVSGTTFTSLDYNGDNVSDLQVMNPSSAYSGMLTIATVPGQVYTVNYEVLNQTPAYINAIAYACPGGLITPNHVTTTPGVYSYTFTATSTLTRLKWLGGSAGNYVMSNISITGAGDPTGGTGDEVISYYADVVSHTDYFPFGWELAGRAGTDVYGFRYSFQGQEKDDEVVGASNSINYNFRILDTRIGRWSSLDPKIKSWESPYVSMGNSPILFLDPHGDDIINGVTKVVQEKEAAVLKSQESYDALVSSHVGELKNGDIRKYKKESGLNYALDELEKWQNIKTDVDQMISTFATVMPEEFEFLSNLTDQSGNCIDVVIDYQDRASPLGDTNPASTQMNAGATTVMNPDGDVYVVWNGSFHGNIISVTLWASGINTKFLANEFGDIDYFFRKVKPNDRESIETWQTTGSSKYPGYYRDPEGAGQQSFKYQERFEKAFDKYIQGLSPDKYDLMKRILL